MGVETSDVLRFVIENYMVKKVLNAALINLRL